jgi:hypothetical protein
VISVVDRLIEIRECCLHAVHGVIEFVSSTRSDAPGQDRLACRARWSIAVGGQGDEQRAGVVEAALHRRGNEAS